MGGAHQHDHADLLLRDLRRPAARGGDRADQEGDREDLRQAGRGGRPAQLRRRRRDARAPARGDGARPRSPRHAAVPPIVSRRGARLRQARHRRDAGRQGRPAARSAPSRSTAPGRPAPPSGRSATSPSRSRSGTRRSASSATSARSSARTRRSAPRSTTPPTLAKRPGDLQVDRLQGRRVQGHEVHHPGRARGLHRLHAVRDGLPGQGQVEPEAQGASTWRRSAPLREAERANYAFFLALPEVDRDDGQARRQGHAVPAAALRVLRRLRRLRRDAVHQAADPALRRPRADRQRHRLLVDLRRQPADHARTRTNRDGRGPAWANSLFEDNAEFGLGMRLALDKHARAGRASSLERPGRQARRQPGDGPARRRPVDRGRHRRPARARRRPASRRSAGIDGLRGAAARCSSPTTSCRRASGSSAATAGPTTSATAASTTCSRIRPQRQHPGARHRGLLEHRRPAVEGDADRRRRPSSRSAGKAAAEEGPRPDGDDLRPRLRRARRLRRQGRADGARRSRRPSATRPVAHHRLQPLHRPRLRPGARRSSSRSWRSTRGVWPLYRFDPRRAGPGRAAARCSTPAPPKISAIGSTCATRRASAWSSSIEPRALQDAAGAAAEKKRPSARSPSTSSWPDHGAAGADAEAEAEPATAKK